MTDGVFGLRTSTNAPIGLVPARIKGPFGCATSQDYGNHSRVRRQDAHERRYARDIFAFTGWVTWLT
jgi:hypothetical protein